MGCREAPGTTQGMGKHSLRHGKAGTGSGVSGPAMRLGPWGSHALGHLGTTESRGRSENGFWACGLGTACSPEWWEGGGRGRKLWLVPAGKVLGLTGSRLDGDCGWEHREAFYRRLGCSSLGKGLLQVSTHESQ